MPSTITHGYFALDVYDGLDKETKQRLLGHKEYLKTFAQGPDFFYFYNILLPCCNKKIKAFGKLVHKNKTKAFYINIIKYIKKHKLENNYDVISFLYGFMMHYFLDSTTHPFIFYKTGIFNKKKKDTYKYRGLHNDMESYIDAYFINVREKIRPKDFKAYRFCFNVTNFSKPLAKTIDYAFNETFNKRDISGIYFKCIKNMKRAYRLLSHDPWGIKKIMYIAADKLLSHFSDKSEVISHNIDSEAKIHYLNLEKEAWNYPVDINERYNYSFIELYSIALKKTIKAIEEVNKVLYKRQSIKTLNPVFLNLSYFTGKDCTLKLKQQYFEF